MAAKAPANMKGPNGMSCLRVARPHAIIAMPPMAASANPAKPPAMSSRQLGQASSIPVLATQQVLLRDAVETDVPVFGICLGGQLLAGALGGEVRPAGEPERGWLEIAPSDSARDDPIFGILERATGVYTWHDDVFDPPPGSRVLASTPAAPNQAFRIDGTDAWGIQFHPETTPALWELWMARHPREVEEAGVDVEAMRREVYAGSERSHSFRAGLFDAFINRVRSRYE